MAGQGRVSDCLGGLSRVGISSRSTRPWNGQPPSTNNGCSLRGIHHKVSHGIFCSLKCLNCSLIILCKL